MKSLLAAAAVALALPGLALAATPLKHNPTGPGGPGGAAPPFSGSVQAGDTL